MYKTYIPNDFLICTYQIQTKTPKPELSLDSAASNLEEKVATVTMPSFEASQEEKYKNTSEVYK